MPPGGWYRMHRGWMDDPLFARDAFSRAQAWVWLIESAAYEPHDQWFNGHKIPLDRGEFVTSERTLCDAWKWDRQRIRTFLKHLETDKKLTRQLTSGLTKISICNYDKYQSDQPTGKPTDQPTTNPRLTQDKPTTEEGKEREEGKEIKNPTTDARYAFFGRVIKLVPNDLEQWRRVYHSIPDLEAELTALDAWLVGQNEKKRAGWFHTVSGALNRRHQENLASRQADEKTPVIGI